MLINVDEEENVGDALYVFILSCSDVVGYLSLLAAVIAAVNYADLQSVYIRLSRRIITLCYTHLFSLG